MGGILALLADGAAFARAIPMPQIGKPPPRELRIFKWGLNETTKGPLTFDEDSAKLVMSAFASRGVAQSFDLWHSQFDDTLPPEKKLTVGNYFLEVRGSAKAGDGGLFVTQCQFSPDVAAEISQGKWPYLSPVPLHTKEGKIVDVRGCALVGRPATCGAVPLLLSSLGVSPMSKGRLMKDCYASMELMSQRCQALASDGDDDQQKTLANTMLTQLSPAMQSMADHMRSTGMMESTMAALSDERKRAAASDRCIKLLSDEMGESDPDKLAGKLIALKIKSEVAPDGTDKAKAEAAKATLMAATLLCDQNAHRATVDRRRTGWIKAVVAGEMALETLQTTLSDLPEVTAAPSTPEVKTPPLPPPTSQAAAELSDAAKAKDAPPTAPTMMTLSDGEKIGLDFMIRTQRDQLGDKFDESAARASYLTTLSDQRKLSPLMNS